MYLEFFDLKQAPFSITPDPEFVYLSEKHQESLAHLIYGVTRGGGAGFVQLTGEVGTGKTTISRLFLQKLPEDTQAALILNPNITPEELLENIFKELKISTRGIKGKLNAMVDKLNTQLLSWWSAGKNTLVIIDEAQNIPRDTLEQLRLLTNLETDQQKLLQIILIGQPELKQLMQRKDLRQLSQRITSRFHLQPLSKDETTHYIKHRVAVSGGDKDLFSLPAINKIFQQTGGIPRLINVLCDRALLVAFVAETKQVKSKQVKTAVAELYPDQKKSPRTYAFAALSAVLFFTVLAWQFFNPKTTTEQTLPADTVVDTISTTMEIKYPSKAVSWQQYLALWGEPDGFIWSKNACPDVTMIGMACLLKQGNLNKIKQLNVPVMLQLSDGNLVLLKAIKDDELMLATSDGDLSISAPQLNNLWYGHYFILWPLAVELIDGTIDSSTTTWALNMAQVIDNNPNLGPQNLNQWIVDFQQANGLLADGIIGKETQMALSLMAYQGPKLTE
ncbi:AAA family ATPase [Marinicella sp. S1101]|uniref:AAA family ATPase n=1 Tax=Marinicella marina TaxID=2996016 RepID=UPI0022609B3A|nr:AAA family ATPase [Marinicella marina]MCX7552794.1 AAA family ATPase [Marinicella marina]MDJ1139897.1 AAA family ATPase [Marinicella marina]